jgi:AcrR family transcriptional regulator
MGDLEPPVVVRRGRPRSEEAERAILNTTVHLLEEVGFVALTMEDVAHLAGVGKATIYRRWPTKGLLVFEAFQTDFLSRLPVRDTGTLRGDLLFALRAWIRTVDGTVAGRTLRELIAEVQRDPALGDAWRERFVQPVRERHRILVARGVARGELAPGTDAEVLLDLVFGPAYHRLLQSHLPFGDRFAQTVIDAIISGVGPDTAPRSRPAKSPREGSRDASAPGSVKR